MRETFARRGRSRPRLCVGADSSESLSFNAPAQAEYENDDPDEDESEAQPAFAPPLDFNTVNHDIGAGKNRRMEVYAQPRFRRRL